MLQAIKRYELNPTDCINATTQALSTYNSLQSFTRASALGTHDTASLKTGLSYTATQKKITDQINAAIANPTSTSTLSYLPDENVVINTCTNSDCYNKWVDQQNQITLDLSVGDKYPSNAATNPQMTEYRAKYAEWLRKRSQARLTIQQSSMLVAYKTEANYTQAVNSYATNAGVDTTTAATTIQHLYPNSNKVGLTNREMSQAVYVALLSKNQPGANDSDADQKTLTKAKARAESDENMYTQYQQALETASQPPPPLSATSLSTTTSTTK